MREFGKCRSKPICIDSSLIRASQELHDLRSSTHLLAIFPAGQSAVGVHDG